MHTFELFILSVGLSMDAVAVAVCKGLSVRRLRARQALVTGLWFGGFQAAMPLLGYGLGRYFQSYIVRVDHWVAFLLLGLLGANMIRESFGEAETVNASFSPRAMLPMALATSIDALAVGVTFAFLGVDILPAVSFIGGITFALSLPGVWVGHLFGARFKAGAERVGGVVLILMGTKILLEHLGIWEAWLGRLL